MFVIIGCIVVLGSVLAGFSMAGGHVGALIHLSEFVTIGGASLGGLIIMAPTRVLKDVVKGVIHGIKGSPFQKQAYLDLFKLYYALCRMTRRDGQLALDSHVNDPQSSDIFTRFPRISKNPHIMHFITSNLSMVVDGNTNLAAEAESEICVIENEHHDAVSALTKTADALPGFGIVAAVLGIVITMQAIDGPAEEIGHKVGAALVGTFLGILLSYGFFAPMACRMELLGAEEMAFFRTIVALTANMTEAIPPKDVIKRVVRSVGTNLRPTRQEVEALFNEIDNS
jgi:chemotaxis protein MotA